MYNIEDSVLLKDGEIAEVIGCVDKVYILKGYDDFGLMYLKFGKDEDIESVIPF